MKNFIIIILLVSLICGFAYSDNEVKVLKIPKYDPDKIPDIYKSVHKYAYNRKEFLKNKIKEYDDELNKRKQTLIGFSKEKHEEFMRDRIIELLKSYPPESHIARDKADLEIAAICYTLAGEKSILCHDLLKPFTWKCIRDGISRGKMLDLEERKLTEYPVYYLYLSCGQDSKNTLIEIVNDNNIKFYHRLYAYAALYQIDQDFALSIQDEFGRNLNDSDRSLFATFIHNPVVEPWRFPRFYSERLLQRIEKKQNR